MVDAIERSIDPILAMKVVFAGKSVEVVERFKSQIYGTDYIQFQMRVDNAGLNAIGQSWCTLDEFSNKLTKDEPRYHLYRYIHTTENGIRNSIGKNLVFYILNITTSISSVLSFIQFPFLAVFILKTPYHGVASKSGVLYASCKNAVIKELQRLGVAIDLKVIYPIINIFSLK